MKNLVILISGNGSNLQAIIEQCHQQQGIRISAVISNNEHAYGLIRAQQAGIETRLVASNADINKDEYDKRLQKTIDQYSPDLIILAGFMRILRADFVAHYAGKMINIHPSLLPKYPGRHTHQRALAAKDREHGTSVHFVTEEVDGGPLILQARVPVLATDDVNTLMARVQQQEHRIYPIVIHWFCQGRLTQQHNQLLLDGKVLSPSCYSSP